MSIVYPVDVFQRRLQIGDYIAAGMSLDRSSVLRVGEVINIKESVDLYSGLPTGRFSIRVKWRNNGNTTGRRYWEVKDSNIKWEKGYSYAKFVILDKAMVDPFPADIVEDDE